MTDTALWRASSVRKQAANISHYCQYLRAEYQLEFSDYAELHAWSVSEPAEFWQSVQDFCKVIMHGDEQSVFTPAQCIRDVNWWPQATLNPSENLLQHATVRRDQAALICYNESGKQQVLSYAELYSQVARLAATLSQWGVQPGERVAALLPNGSEAVVAMLASAAIGATWSSCSPDFGLAGVSDRFGQIQPVVIFACDHYYYNGKRFDIRDRLVKMMHALPECRYLVLVTTAQSSSKSTDKEFSCPCYRYEDCLQQAATTIDYRSLPFNHPWYILYSSGTTGKPKCIVHSVGGTLIQHVKELVLHSDLKPGDRLFFYTTCGWMMWNWMVSALAVGATLVLYDGSPTYPTVDHLFTILEQEKVTVFGSGARYLAMLEQAGSCPGKNHDLEGLRTILSTGSPLSPESFAWVYKHIKADICLSSISGGTDIVSCFALGNPVLPVFPGELQCIGLGMDICFFDEYGEECAVGQRGNLVCRNAFPSMPLGFFGDVQDEKFHHAYFSQYPGVWSHGDYGELTGHGGVIIHGRSDAVLNPGGVRIGTAEIYRQVERVAAVIESVAIGQPWQGDERIILFVRLAAGVKLDDPLQTQIKSSIRNHASPRHVPAKIVQVPDIPRTLNGKVAELAVRNAITGEPVKNKEALANPESLAFYTPQSIPK